MSRAFLAICAVLLTSAPLLPAAAPAAAQATQPDAQGRCANRESRRRRGNMIGGLGGRILNRAGVPSSVAGVGIPTEAVLSETITSMLDCREREQAATATNEAIRGGVGTTTSWQSESRPNVSGSSMVTGQRAEAGGGECMTVTDVVIVDGEETRAPKTMCRRPPHNRYVRV
ncbi:MAG TPA: hypothetical protein VEW25_00255 [Allosphingosinicella sp.]|nr:hypothetical protein [Allosphingosinicella sp.]